VPTCRAWHSWQYSTILRFLGRTALLGETAAIFVDKNGHDVLVAHKDDVIIKVKGKVLLGKTLKASIRIGDHKFEGTISPESYQSYMDWKTLKEDEVIDVQRAEDETSGDEDIREEREF